MGSGSAFRFTSQPWWRRLLLVLWAITMVALPVTSFPLINRLTGATVAPASAIPLAILIFLWFIPYVLQRGSLPKETVPFVAFTFLVIGLAVYAFFMVEGTFRDKSLFGQTLRTFVPFSIGLAFFIILSAWHKDPASLRQTLQWVYVGGIVMLVWSVAEAIIVLKYHWQYPPLMLAIKNALVTQSEMFGNPRLAGLTWEASWFAHQLNMLYLPLWLAATYQRTSVFPRLWKISFENIFLLVGTVLFFLTSPRIGGLAFLMMLFFLFVKFNLAIYRWVIRRLEPLWVKLKRPGLFKVGVGILMAIVFLAIYAGFSAGVVRVASARDWRVRLLLQSPLSNDELKQLKLFDENTIFYLAIRFAFLERTVYWMDGFRIFNDYPILGVGLGNAGYYFMSHLPAVGWASIEVRQIAHHSEGLPNIKSIWFRLLAETGIVGFSVFVSWLFVLWSSASKSIRCRDDTIRTVALAGQLVLLAFIFEGFSVDTFGLPYLFFMAGLVASTGWIVRHPKI